MRVITGSARGRRLKTLPGTEEVRPTTDMVKEAVFSMVQFLLPGAVVLDLFAGSGQMGIEALSRGAAQAVFVDSNRAAINVVSENLDLTRLTQKAKIVTMDYANFLMSTAQQFDIAFLDPPYHKGILPKALPMLEKKMNPGGVILCEQAVEEALPKEVGRFALVKETRYGKIKITQYRMRQKDEGEE